MQSSYFGPGTEMSILHALSPKPSRQPYVLYVTIRTIPIQTPKPVSNHRPTLSLYSSGQNLKVTVQLCDYSPHAGPPRREQACFLITVLCTWSWHSNSCLEKAFS